MKILVTGGAGFIGSNLVDKLIDNKHDVVILDNLSTGFEHNLNKKAKFVNVDINEYDKIYPFFEGIDAVFHLAALPRVEPSIHDPVPYDRANIGGTVSVLKASIDAKVKKFIFSSSSSIYGECGLEPVDEEKIKNPLSPYALQKLTGEMYCKLMSDVFKIDTFCLRYFNVYGNRQPTIGAYVPVVGIFMKQLSEGKPLTVTGDGQQVRDFVNVLDVVEANYSCLNNNLKGYNYFNVGTGKNYKILDIANKISNNIKFIESRIEPRFTLANISKAESELNWVPKYDLLKWIEEQYK